MISTAQVRAWLPAEAAAHKDERGRVLVVGGSPEYSGAPLLAGMAAARAGAGVVRLALARGLALALAGRAPELTFLPLAEASPGMVQPGAAAEVGRFLADERYRGVAIGPGMGQAQSTRGFLFDLLARLAKQDVPAGVVIDASALDLLAAEGPGWQRRLPPGAILTPHLGEAARLEAAALPQDLSAWTRERARDWGAVLVLKAQRTLVADPDGRLFEHDRPDPALATAGSGDVLSGVIAALLAAGLPPFRAAALGVLVHGEAGALVAREVGPRGALASDQIRQLPRALRCLGERT